jgi:hypothetical protein
VEPAGSKGGRGKAFILVPPPLKKLVVGNKPVKIGTSDFGTGTLKI